jgi:hypothetical protein
VGVIQGGVGTPVDGVQDVRAAGMEECLEVGVIQGGAGTPVDGVQAVGAGVEECLEVGVIQVGVGTPVDGVQDVGAGWGVSRGGSDPSRSWDSCRRSSR